MRSRPPFVGQPCVSLPPVWGGPFHEYAHTMPLCKSSGNNLPAVQSAACARTGEFTQN